MNNTSYIENLISEYHTYGILPESREIFLGSDSNTIGDIEESCIDFKMSNKFIKNVHILNRQSDENILVHFNSIAGGDWYYGLSIYDSIVTNGGYINCLGYGHMASMSSVIFQAFDNRVLMPNCSMMIHWGANSYNPHPRANIAQAEWNELLREKMIDIYVRRCKNGLAFKRKSVQFTRKKFVEMIDKDEDLYLDVDECIYYGLADGFLGDNNYPTIDDVKNAT